MRKVAPPGCGFGGTSCPRKPQRAGRLRGAATAHDRRRGRTRRRRGVAHEAFLSAWPPLAEAIAAASSALRAGRAVEVAAADWDARNRPPDRLWEGGQVAAALTDTGARFQKKRLGTGSEADHRIECRLAVESAASRVSAGQRSPRSSPATPGHNDPDPLARSRAGGSWVAFVQREAAQAAAGACAGAAASCNCPPACRAGRVHP